MNNLVLMIACILVHADFDKAREANAFDRATIIGDAFMLLLVWVLACIAWTGFFATVLSLAPSIAMGLLFGTMTAALDRAMGASDWTLSGVLRQGRPSAGWWGRIAVRFALGVMLAQATAFGLQMVIFRPSIEQQVRREQAEENTPLEQEFHARKVARRQELLTPLSSELETLNQERTQLLGQIKQDDDVRRSATSSAVKQRAEADREESGDQPGYVPGRGPKFKEAQRLADAAATLKSESDRQIGTARSRLAALDKRVTALTSELGTASTQLQRFDKDTDQEKLQDSRWNRGGNDPILAVQALHTLKTDPKRGTAVKDIVWLTNIVTLALEFAFLLVKMIFAPTSVYLVRLIADTKFDAETINVEHQRRMRTLHDGAVRPGLRVVPAASANLGAAAAPAAAPAGPQATAQATPNTANRDNSAADAGGHQAVAAATPAAHTANPGRHAA